MQRHDNARNALRAVQDGAEVFGEAFVGQGAEAFEQVAVALEVGAQHFGNGQDIMPVRHRGHDLVEDKPGRGLHVLLVAGRAEPAALAGKGQEVLVLAVIAADAGKPSLQITTLQKLVDHLGDDGAQDAVARLVKFFVNFLELVIVPAGALPQRRFLRVSGAIDLH